MPDEDPEDSYDGIFVGGDGINSSVPWRLKAYGFSGALTEAQVAELADRFDLPPGLVGELSVGVGMALDPVASINLIPLSRSVAAKRAREEVLRAQRDIGAAWAQLEDRLADLKRLSLGVYDSRDPQEPFHRAQAILAQCIALLPQARDALTETLQEPDRLLLLTPTDKRKVPDRRRIWVLDWVFLIWRAAGRPLRCSTDHDTGERRGPLIDFVNAVVLCVTEPPLPLKPETIYRDLRAFRARSDGSVMIENDGDD